MEIKNSHRILIVDDDLDILSLLKYNIEKEGYQVRTINKSLSALTTAIQFNPDLIILDIMMPEKNGIELCHQLRTIRKFEDTYIFFLTAKSEHYLQSAAFEMGGDDYIEKITGLRALNYKISSVLKDNLIIRKREKQLKIGELLLKRDGQMISYGDKIISLPKFEFELLYFLAQNPKTVVSENHLLHNIWGSEIYLLSRSVDAYVDNIINKLGVHIIKKVNKTGFKLSLLKE